MVKIKKQYIIKAHNDLHIHLHYSHYTHSHAQTHSQMKKLGVGNFNDPAVTQYAYCVSRLLSTHTAIT